MRRAKAALILLALAGLVLLGTGAANTPSRPAPAARTVAATVQTATPEMICGQGICGDVKYLEWGDHWEYMGPGSPYWHWMSTNPTYNVRGGIAGCLVGSGGYFLVLPVGGEVAWASVGVLCLIGGIVGLF